MNNEEDSNLKLKKELSEIKDELEKEVQALEIKRDATVSEFKKKLTDIKIEQIKKAIYQE